MFLTTNRVGNIDPAFKSRIHLSLYYPSLDRERTLQIWKNNLESLQIEHEKEFREGGKKEPVFHKKEILKFAGEHFDKLQENGLLVWNGR